MVRLIDATKVATDVRKVAEMHGENSLQHLVAITCANMLDDEGCTPTVKIDGNTSDGYHTFNELYHHRAVLFSVIVRIFPDLAWKSKRHDDGTMYDGMFIVGLETPDGQATYHYDVDPYWDMFKCAERERAPHWDGHTPQQAIERIGKLDISARWEYEEDYGDWYCNKCYGVSEYAEAYCPDCGRRMTNAAANQPQQGRTEGDT